MGYAQATGYYKKETRPTLYQPLNLLDARDATAWCSSSADPLNDQLSFGFNEVIKLEALRIATGNGFNHHTFEQFARARKLVIKSGKQSKTIELEDQRGWQNIVLDPPMVGARFTVEVLDNYPAEDPETPTCLTDVVFIAESRAINGPFLTSKLKYDKAIAGVLGVWFAGYPKTPDRFLAFNFDGTFRYTLEPFEPERVAPKTIEGTYEVASSRLVLQTGGKRYVLKYSKDPAKKGPSWVLSFEGDTPEDLKGPFRSAP